MALQSDGCMAAAPHPTAYLLQVRKALVGYTSVLAGPSGVGKSSIINALRAEAFDDEQRERLAVFKRRMDEEESLWRQYHEGSDESEEFEDDSTPGSSNPGHSDGPGNLRATEPSDVQHQPGAFELHAAFLTV